MQGMIRIYGSPNIPENLFILIAQKKYRVSFVFEKTIFGCVVDDDGPIT